MQQYYNQYPTQTGYYSQPYDGAGAYNAYTSYPQQQPAMWPSATPYASNGAPGLPPPMQMQSGAAPAAINAASRPKQHHRRATLPSNSKPLKSALKRNGTQQAPTPSTPAPLQRKRAISNPKRDPYAPMSMLNDYSHRALNLSQDETVFMFLSFHGNNELHIENLAHRAMEDIRNEVLGMWPGGTEVDELINTKWRVRFRNAPWSLRTEDLTWVWRMLVKLFTLFQERGFAYNTTLDVGAPSPRLVFVASSQAVCRFFLAYFSNGGRTFTMVDPPLEVTRDFSSGLQTALPGYVASDEPKEAGETRLRVVEMRRQAFSGSEVSCGQFHGQLLRILDVIGFELVATIPMARKGPLAMLGIGAKQELMVFKSVKSNPVY